MSAPSKSFGAYLWQENVPAGIDSQSKPVVHQVVVLPSALRRGVSCSL